MPAEVQGIPEALAALRQLPRKLADAAGAGHRELAERAAAQMRATAPQGESGDIRSSIRVERTNPFRTDVVVGREGETFYLGFYEFGRGPSVSGPQPARPFVRPAAGRAVSIHGATMLREARRRIQ